jgi:putative endopeptidase
MGEAIGRTYVARHFPPESKAKMEQLVADLKVAMRGRIERLDWMEPETQRRSARWPSSKFGLKIGYPDEVARLLALEAKPGDLFGNAGARRSSSGYRRIPYRAGRRQGRVGHDAADRQRVLLAAKNEIVFPAAILQPPFFDPNADPR